MARQEKSTRARGLPPRVLLSQRQDATGSFPTVWRTSSDNRTGRYNVSFNDNKVVPFNQYEAADYDSSLPLGNAVYVEKVENVGAVETGGTKTVTYPTAFAGSPIVVISELSSANGDSSQNVNAFLSGIEINNFTVKFSSQFTGSIVYRAVYDPSPGTLRVVERKPRYPNAFTRFIAKEVTLANNNAVDITFNDFGDDTAENFVTFFDSYVNGQADIWPNITTQTRTLVALTASSIATATVEYERFHGLHNRGIIYPLGMNQATILAGLSRENQIEMYGSVSFISGAVVNQPTKWIVASGSMKKNVADTFVTFTPGQDIQAFRDSDNPAVDGKGSGNPFYATGSAVEVTGQGFQQPLWSKSKVEIDITPSISHLIELKQNTDLDGSYPMAYWNNQKKLFEGLGTGKGMNVYTGDLNGLKGFLEEQPIGFAASMDNGSTIDGFREGYFDILGRKISNFGFPYHPKFQPTSSQQILMSDYISEPFLLEKMVLELNTELLFGIDGVQIPFNTNTAIWSFFILNARATLPSNKSQTIQYATTPASNYSTFLTSSNLSNTVSDVVDIIQVALSAATDILYQREQVIPKWFFSTSGIPQTFQFCLSSSVKSPIQSVFSICTFSPRNPATLEDHLLKQTNEDIGRNGITYSDGRDWKTSFQKGLIVGEISESLGLGSPKFNVLQNYTKTNPYILLPTDKLTIGVQLPWDLFGCPIIDPTKTITDKNSIKFLTDGINKITLYGSSLRVNPETNQLEEHHDTLNQLLSSESIHEVIG